MWTRTIHSECRIHWCPASEVSNDLLISIYPLIVLSIAINLSFFHRHTTLTLILAWKTSTTGMVLSETEKRVKDFKMVKKVRLEHLPKKLKAAGTFNQASSKPRKYELRSHRDLIFHCFCSVLYLCC